MSDINEKDINEKDINEKDTRANLAEELYIMKDTVTMFRAALNSLAGRPECYRDLLNSSSSFCELMSRNSRTLLQIMELD